MGPDTPLYVGTWTSTWTLWVSVTLPVNLQTKGLDCSKIARHNALLGLATPSVSFFARLCCEGATMIDWRYPGVVPGFRRDDAIRPVAPQTRRMKSKRHQVSPK